MSHGIDLLTFYATLPMVLCLSSVFLAAALWLAHRRGRGALLLLFAGSVTLIAAALTLRAYLATRDVGAPHAEADVTRNLVYFTIVTFTGLGGGTLVLLARLTQPLSTESVTVSFFGALAASTIGYCIGILTAVLLVFPHFAP